MSCAIVAMALSSCATPRPNPAAPQPPQTSASSSASDETELPPRQVPGLGRIMGVIDGDDGFVRRHHNGLTGATVVVTPAAGGGAFTAITNENGFDSIANVQPGEYVASFYYGDASGGQSSVHVSADRVTSVFGRIRIKGTRPPGWGPKNVPYCRDVADPDYVGACFP